MRDAFRRRQFDGKCDRIALRPASHWDYDDSSSLGFLGNESKAVNMGMAIVTPIQEATSILLSKDFVKRRRDADKGLFP